VALTHVAGVPPEAGRGTEPASQRHGDGIGLQVARPTAPAGACGFRSPTEGPATVLEAPLYHAQIQPLDISPIGSKAVGREVGPRRRVRPRRRAAARQGLQSSCW